MRLLLTYVGIIAAGAAVVAVVLPIGEGITPAPQAPPLGTVEGAGSVCLGDRIAAEQSGVFVELHEPGDGTATSTAGADQLGDTLASGRIDRVRGTGTLRGTCGQGSSLAGQPLAFDVTFRRGADHQPGPIDGDLVVGGERLAVTITPIAAEDTPRGERDALAGGELVARIFLAVALVVAASRAIGYLFHRIRQPRVLGEIVAGILLGPSLLGLVLPGVTRYLFPPEVTSVLQVLAQFGLILFMFLIGLELDHKLLRGSGHSAVLISHVSIVLPFSLGVAMSLLLYPLLGSGRFVGFALFIGASMAITAFPVLARILTDTGLHRTRIGALSITCAAVDDVTAWCILAIVVAVVKSSGAGDAIQTIVLTGVFLVFMLTVVRPLVARLARVHEARGTLNPQVMAGIIVAVLLSAWATEEIGIHAIFGAFMAGAMMPRSPALTRDITDRLEDVTVLLLLPVFFAVAGLSTRFGLLDRSELVWVAVLVIGGAIIGKWGGSMVAARAAGQPWRQANGVGLLMNTRGLTELVILTVGRSLGVISPALFTIMVLMALVTTFMATPLLAITYPRRLIDREIARAAAVERVGRGLGRGPRVLVGVGNPLRAGPLIDLVASWRAPDGSHPHVTLAHVVPPPGREEIRASLSALEAEAAEASEDLSPWRARLRQAGIDVEVVTVVASDAGAELVRLVEQLEPDLVVVGSHEAYLGRNPLGGVAGDLLEGAAAEVAVLLHRGPSPAVTNGDRGPIAVWFKGILNDVPALDLAAGLARGHGTSVRVVQPLPGEVPDLAVPVDAVVLERADLDAALAALEGSSLVVVARATVSDGALPRLRNDVIDAATVSVLVVQGRPPLDQAGGPTVRRQPGTAVAGAAPRP